MRVKLWEMSLGKRKGRFHERRNVEGLASRIMKKNRKNAAELAGLSQTILRERGS